MLREQNKNIPNVRQAQFQASAESLVARLVSHRDTITRPDRPTAAAGTGDRKWQGNFRRFIPREEFLVPLKLTPYAVAAALNVPRTRIERIAREEKPVTADSALRLGKFFKTGAAF
jgi:hypothetical protein